MKDFEDWLARERRYSPAGARSVATRIQRLADAYGDLFEHHRRDGLETVLNQLAYGTLDKRLDRKNPSGVPIDGDLLNGLASLKSAANLYRKYLEEPSSLSLRNGGGLTPPVMPRRPPADALAELPPPSGGDILFEATLAMGVDLVELVARCSIWAHPRVVATLMQHDHHAAWFPGVRRLMRDEKRGTFVNGVKLDDNTAANRAMKFAVFGGAKATGFHVCHIWPETCYDHRYHTSIANMVMLPAAVAGLSDYDRAVAAALRYRAFQLYGWRPEEQPAPPRPAGYPPDAAWRSIPEPPAAVHRVLLKRKLAPPR